MTPSAKRAKGTQLCEWVADKIREVFSELPADCVIVPKSSAHGEDLQFSAELEAMLNISVECKNQRSYGHAYKDMEQCVKNSKGKTPILIVKAPYKEPLVIMRWADYQNTLGE